MRSKCVVSLHSVEVHKQVLARLRLLIHEADAVKDSHLAVAVWSLRYIPHDDVVEDGEKDCSYVKTEEELCSSQRTLQVRAQGNLHSEEDVGEDWDELRVRAGLHG